MSCLQICIICGEEKLLDDFYTHPAMANGHLGKCKECCKKQERLRYKNNVLAMAIYDRQRQQTQERRNKKLVYQQTRRKNNPEKHKANQQVRHALRRGTIKKQPCAVCGSEKVQAHHKDYSKPLDVMWLCFPHHLKEHGKETRVPF
jgi:hypothetical protein